MQPTHDEHLYTATAISVQCARLPPLDPDGALQPVGQAHLPSARQQLGQLFAARFCRSTSVITALTARTATSAGRACWHWSFFVFPNETCPAAGIVCLAMLMIIWTRKTLETCPRTLTSFAVGMHGSALYSTLWGAHYVVEITRPCPFIYPCWQTLCNTPHWFSRQEAADATPSHAYVIPRTDDLYLQSTRQNTTRRS